ncbi:hypothetical protein [Pseudomonas sp.]|uniref:hypothetical protein n=1 Tax=Pseudomonas sp. TaxID=306 RepID=UPI001B0557F4|nr:hypothetical protein [Pseudomonas sp.]MBO9547943.1 hypothetical protein [Pseudomonas sp.]
MNFQIEQASVQGRPRWRVHACGMTFTFPTQESAHNFASKLAERVDAPHPLPAETLKYWDAQQARMKQGIR